MVGRGKCRCKKLCSCSRELRYTSDFFNIFFIDNDDDNDDDDDDGSFLADEDCWEG